MYPAFDPGSVGRTQVLMVTQQVPHLMSHFPSPSLTSVRWFDVSGLRSDFTGWVCQISTLLHQRAIPWPHLDSKQVEKSNLIGREPGHELYKSPEQNHKWCIKVGC